MAVHRRRRAPVLDYRCGHCRRVFNAFTGTALHGVKRRPGELVLIVRGFAQGVPTAQLARELELRPLGAAEPAAPAPGPGLPEPRPDAAGRRGRWRPTRPTRTRGKKGVPHPDPEDPPRRRAQQGPRPRHLGERPAAGLRGGRARERAGPADGRRARPTARRCERVVRRATWPMATVNTDEWGGYNGLPAMGRSPRDGLPRRAGVGAGRRRGRDPRGPRQHAGGAVDGAAELPAAVPGREQEVPVPVRGDVRVGLQRQAGDAGVPVGILGVRSATTCPT